MTHAASNVVPLHADGDGDLVLIAPGDYLAMYVGHRTFEIFRHMKLRVDFRLIEYTQPVTLSRWYRVRDCRGGRISASRSSDLVRELEAVLNMRLPRLDRIPVTALADRDITIRVRTVTKDHRQKAIAEVSRYSTIDALTP